MLRTPQTFVNDMSAERSDVLYQHRGFLPGTEDRAPSHILVVDDHATHRYHLRQALDNHARLSVIGEAADGVTAVTIACEAQPDIVIIGMRLADMSGIALARQLLRVLPMTRVVLMSGTISEQLVMDAMQAGAFGFLPSTIAPDALVRAIVGVADGEVALSRRDAARLLGRLRRSDELEQPTKVKLTKREIEVVRLLGEGATDRQIAQYLTIEESTAKKHVQHILRKLRARNRNEAVAKYLGELVAHT